MNSEEIKKGNELIFRFLGKEYAHWTHENRTSWISARKDTNSYVYSFFDNYEDLAYHTSWDWLMPVVEKIYSIDYTDVQIQIHTCFINFGDGKYRDYVYRQKDLAMIEMVFLSIIKFIEWYNLNK